MTSIWSNYINSFWLFRKCIKTCFRMRKHRYLKNDYRFFDTLKTKDRKIRANCNLLIKVKFHELEWSSPLSKSWNYNRNANYKHERIIYSIILSWIILWRSQEKISFTWTNFHYLLLLHYRCVWYCGSFFCDYMFISFIRNICGWKVVMWILVIDKCKHNWSEIVFHCFRFKRDNKKNLTEKIPSLWYSFSQVTYECNNWIQSLFWLKVV